SCRQRARATERWRSLASLTWRNTRNIGAVSASTASSLTLIAFETRAAASSDTSEASCDPCLGASKEEIPIFGRPVTLRARGQPQRAELPRVNKSVRRIVFADAGVAIGRRNAGSEPDESRPCDWCCAGTWSGHGLPPRQAWPASYSV